MNCSPKQTYTLSFTYGVGENFEKGDTRGGKDNAMILELTDCEARAFDGIHSECKEVRIASAKRISKLLNS